MNELITVIVPIYNTGEYLEACVKSIQCSTYENLEILLIDDGSTDDSLSIAKRFEKMDKRIKVIHKENGGVSSARNEGIKKANGEFLCFVDSDDQISSNMIQRLHDMLVEYQCDISLCKARKVKSVSNELLLSDKDGFVEVINREDAIYEILLEGKVGLSMCAGLFHKKLFGNGLMFDSTLKINEDYLLKFRLLETIERIAVMDEELYFYVQRESSCTHGSFGNAYFDVLKVTNYFLRATEKNKRLYEAAEYRRCGALFSVINRIIISGEFTERLDELILELKSYRKKILRRKIYGWKYKMAILALCSMRFYGKVIKLFY